MTIQKNILPSPVVGDCVLRLPDGVTELLQGGGISMALAGGMIRDMVLHQEPQDVDIFVNTDAYVPHFGQEASIIRRREFSHPMKLIEGFDFTINRACIWYDRQTELWQSAADECFLEHCQDKVLHFGRGVTHPSVARVIDFYERGYRPLAGNDGTS